MIRPLGQPWTVWVKPAPGVLVGPYPADSTVAPSEIGWEGQDVVTVTHEDPAVGALRSPALLIDNVVLAHGDWVSNGATVRFSDDFQTDGGAYALYDMGAGNVVRVDAAPGLYGIGEMFGTADGEHGGEPGQALHLQVTASLYGRDLTVFPAVDTTGTWGEITSTIQEVLDYVNGNALANPYFVLSLVGGGDPDALWVYEPPVTLGGNPLDFIPPWLYQAISAPEDPPFNTYPFYPSGHMDDPDPDSHFSGPGDPPVGNRVASLMTHPNYIQWSGEFPELHHTGPGHRATVKHRGGVTRL